MNKIISGLLILILFISCDSESANDCFQQAGNIMTQEVAVPVFTKVRVNRDVSLVITEGATQRVIVETGENLFNDISLSVEGEWLIITDNNTCNFVREYGLTKVYITVPDLKEINSSTQFQVNSNGVLNFDELRVASENFHDSSVHAVGEINLQLNSVDVDVVGNNLTNFVFSGSIDDLNVSVASGDGKFNMRYCLANKVRVYHRGTNTVTINPVQELSAELRSTGNLIVVNQPSIQDLEVHYTGQIIFE